MQHYKAFLNPSEIVPRLVYLMLVVMATVFGNLLVIIAVVKFKKLRRSTNLMLASLAVADLMVGFITVPLYILWTVNPEVFDQSGFLCRLVLLSCLLFVAASQVSLLLLSVERYLAVCQPFQHRALMLHCPWIHKAAICFIWVVSGITTAASSLAIRQDYTTCSYYGAFDKMFLFLAVLFGIFVLFLAIIVINIKVFWSVRATEVRLSFVTNPVLNERRQSSDFCHHEALDPSIPRPPTRNDWTCMSTTQSTTGFEASGVWAPKIEKGDEDGDDEKHRELDKNDDETIAAIYMRHNFNCLSSKNSGEAELFNGGSPMIYRRSSTGATSQGHKTSEGQKLTRPGCDNLKLSKKHSSVPWFCKFDNLNFDSLPLANCQRRKILSDVALEINNTNRDVESSLACLYESGLRAQSQSRLCSSITKTQNTTSQYESCVNNTISSDAPWLNDAESRRNSLPILYGGTFSPPLDSYDSLTSPRIRRGNNQNDKEKSLIKINQRRNESDPGYLVPYMKLVDYKSYGDLYSIMKSRETIITCQRAKSTSQLDYCNVQTYCTFKNETCDAKSLQFTGYQDGDNEMNTILEKTASCCSAAGGSELVKVESCPREKQENSREGVRQIQPRQLKTNIFSVSNGSENFEENNRNNDNRSSHSFVFVHNFRLQHLPPAPTDIDQSDEGGMDQMLDILETTDKQPLLDCPLSQTVNLPSSLRTAPCDCKLKSPKKNTSLFDKFSKSPKKCSNLAKSYTELSEQNFISKATCISSAAKSISSIFEELLIPHYASEEVVKGQEKVRPKEFHPRSRFSAKRIPVPIFAQVSSIESENKSFELIGHGVEETSCSDRKKQSQGLSVFINEPEITSVPSAIPRSANSGIPAARANQKLSSCSIQDRARRMSHLSRQTYVSTKVARTVTLVCTSFILAWLPFFVVIIYNTFCVRCDLAYALNAVLMVAFGQSASNPVIYALCHASFRRAYQSLLNQVCSKTSTNNDII